MHNILIVDDESGIRQSLKGVLEDEGDVLPPRQDPVAPPVFTRK
jgi:CheY-like chemotaxis protein